MNTKYITWTPLPQLEFQDNQKFLHTEFVLSYFGKPNFCVNTLQICKIKKDVEIEKNSESKKDAEEEKIKKRLEQLGYLG